MTMKATERGAPRVSGADPSGPGPGAPGPGRLRPPRLLAVAGALAVTGLPPAFSRADVAEPRPVAPPPLPWGSAGHHIISRAAVGHLPPEMPAFFRGAGEQLEYLGPEPDRWRSRDLKEMDDAWEFDHYIDLENVPEGALNASDRYEFIAALYGAGIQRPQQFVGFLPWRILELYQRLLTEMAIWRNSPEGPQRRFVEARILNDAGILGHFAADASQPHHTTIHFNGWAAEAPNPRGFTTARDFHARFESAFVEAHVTSPRVDALMAPAPLPIGDAREAIWAHVRAGNAQVERMYELELEHGFDPDAPAAPEVVDFVVRRLVAGAEMLRALWWSAWIQSDSLAAQRRAQGWTG